jgi:hypothetical protein
VTEDGVLGNLAAVAFLLIGPSQNHSSKLVSNLNVSHYHTPPVELAAQHSMPGQQQMNWQEMPRQFFDNTQH